MRYFMDTVETVPENVGFEQFGFLHICWLLIFIIVTACNTLWFRKQDVSGRKKWKKTTAILLLIDELFKVVMLIAGGRYMPKYLPLHLCSINIFLIAIHAWKPSRTLSAFLYTVCIPGAVAALLFPSWASLPLTNFMHIHSFTVHILLAMYPIVMTAGGEWKPKLRDIPGCMLLLLAMAIPIAIINVLLDTNFMFLMYPEEGNPLNWFAQNWGNHLYGFPVLIAAVLIIMYLPTLLFKKKSPV